MDMIEAMRQRHSVRSYEARPIESETLWALEQVIADCNRESGLHIQLVKNEPKAFDSKIDLGIAKYHFEVGSGKDSEVWA